MDALRATGDHGDGADHRGAGGGPRASDPPAVLRPAGEDDGKAITEADTSDDTHSHNTAHHSPTASADTDTKGNHCSKAT